MVVLLERFYGLPNGGWLFEGIWCKVLLGYYQALCDGQSPPHLWNAICGTLACPKIVLLGVRFKKGLHGLKLHTKKKIIGNWYCMCKTDGESGANLLFCCSVAWDLSTFVIFLVRDKKHVFAPSDFIVSKGLALVEGRGRFWKSSCEF